MIEKIRPVGNPLTIIAIFAALAELAGSVVLALVPPQVQTVFVWFVMLFPSALVLMFFITLWVRNHVLYAPKDFANEDNYMAFLGNSGKLAKTFEHLEKKIEELDGIVRPKSNDADAIQANDLSKVDPAPPASETEKEQPNTVDVKAVDVKLAEIKDELAKAQVNASVALSTLAFSHSDTQKESALLPAVISRVLKLFDRPMTPAEICGYVGRPQIQVTRALNSLLKEGRVGVAQTADGDLGYFPASSKTIHMWPSGKAPTAK